MTDVILPQVQATQEIEDTHVTLTPVNPDGQQQSSSVSSGFVSNMLNPNQDTGVDDIFGQHTEATSLIDTPVTAIMEPSFTAQINRPPTPYPLTKAVRRQLLELRQTNQYAEALSSIPSTVDQYLANKMQDAVDVAIHMSMTRIRRRVLYTNQQFLESIDAGMKKIIKDQVKKEVSKVIPKIEKLVTDQLESEVLMRSSKEANTSHAVAANLSELELKKILIDKMETNNSINRSDIQRQLYKALTGGPKRKSGKRPALPCSRKRTTKDSRKDYHTGSKDSQENLLANSAPGVQDEQAEEDDPHLPTGPTFELMKGTCKSLTELEYFCEEVYKATTEKLDWINPEGRQYPHDLRQPLPLVPNSQGRRVIPFHHFINNDLEYLRGGVSSRNSMHLQLQGNQARDSIPQRRIICGQKGEIVEWHDYKHLDWITVRRDDDVLYKFKEGDFHRLRIQDIEDMLLLLVQGKVTNLSVEERIAFNVSLRMFTRRVVIQRRVEDLQLGVESYQKKLNLTKPDTYRSNLRRQDAYTPYSDPRGFIYENKGQEEYSLIRIDEQHNSAMPSDFGQNIRVNSFTMKMEILLEPTSNKLMVGKVLKLKNFKKDATLKLQQNGMSMSVQKSQVHKVAKFQDGKEIVLG
ncbi:hypothetical protein Tco_0414855 [Tanacetum coccineum]